MNFKSFLLTALSVVTVNTSYALTYSEATTGEIMLQGGSQSTISWATPTPGLSEVFVNIPKTSTAQSVTYRIYPKGTADASVCSETDTVSPCFEAQVNQSTAKGKLVKLAVGKVSKWDFSANGFVSVLASKSATGELVGAENARFNQVSQTLKYTKISNKGTALASTATLGTGDNDWACTRDDNTNLIWEIKTSDKGLRDKDSLYSWYDSNPATNKGYAGLADGEKGKCTGGIACDTEAYVKAVNEQGLCGFKDWRLPTFRELVSLLKLDVPPMSPMIDTTYFPNTVGLRNWTSTTEPAYPERVSYFFFGIAATAIVPKTSTGLEIGVRLVRNGQ